MTEPLAAFRAEVREWLAANFPASLAGDIDMLARLEAPDDPSPDELAWRRAVGAEGWGTPTWPAAYGGGGLGEDEAAVLREEMARIGAWNPIGGMGVMMFGPTLLEFGTEAQKQEHIPPICRGEVRWCQGYSEPNAGSDLASLQTFAEDQGDHYLVNGQKTWTSGGQWAHKCFALVRTDRSQKHEGISFLLIDMDAPGVEVRPIRMISGVSPFCETFFTDVKVPKANLVGREGQGWTIGKRLLQHERTNIASASSDFGLDGVKLPDLALAHIGADADGRIADPDLRGRIAKWEMDWRIFLATAARVKAEAEATGGVSATSSILKTAGTRLEQERAEIIIEIRGLGGLGAGGDGFDEEALRDTRAWLLGKASTIYGGSSEIQANVIAKTILGMRDHQ